MTDSASPLLRHPLDQPSAFRPEQLMGAVREQRSLSAIGVPQVCVLDFDGDLADGLIEDGAAVISASWACFHTQMLLTRAGALECGVIPRTIGGPYAVLIAEQLHAAGAKLIIGLTSAGRLSPSLSLPSIVVIDEAVRDEGTSLHYLPPAKTVATPSPALIEHLLDQLAGISPVRRGLVWTTDAPYRETEQQLHHWRDVGALAVEMQAASLFAFGQSKGAAIAVVAMVSNSVDGSTTPFDTGGHAYRVQLLTALVTAGHRFLEGNRSNAGSGAPPNPT